MSALDQAVIVGSGQSAIRAIEALRAASSSLGITLIDGEGTHAYSRPPLSKDFLRFEKGPDDVRLKVQGWMQDNRVSVISDLASAIDPKAKRVYLGKRALVFDRLLLATGSRPRRLDVPGEGLSGVFYLRTLADALALRMALSVARSVVVVGGGLIGLEVAASAVKFGGRITMLEAAPRLLQRVTGGVVSAFFHHLHQGHGIRIVTGCSVREICGDNHVDGVVTRRGERIEADLVIVGIGVVPNADLAEDAGLLVQDGIVVDRACRTNMPHIFAAGDVARQPNAFLGSAIRLESEQNAQEQGTAAGQNMAGANLPYESKLWFWSDQYDCNFQAIGVPAADDHVVIRGQPSSGRFLAFYLRDGRIVAVNAINDRASVFSARRLIAAATPVDPEQLADERVSLAELTRTSADRR